MNQNAPASEIHPDVTDLAQRIVDEVNKLVAGVETLDANNWLESADVIDRLNQQLQAILIPDTREPTDSPDTLDDPKKSTTSKKS
jgi:hypothetical protein